MGPYTGDVRLVAFGSASQSYSPTPSQAVSQSSSQIGTVSQTASQIGTVSQTASQMVTVSQSQSLTQTVTVSQTTTPISMQSQSSTQIAVASHSSTQFAATSQSSTSSGSGTLSVTHSASQTNVATLTQVGNVTQNNAQLSNVTQPQSSSSSAQIIVANDNSSNGVSLVTVAGISVACTLLFCTCCLVLAIALWYKHRKQRLGRLLSSAVSTIRTVGHSDSVRSPTINNTSRVQNNSDAQHQTTFRVVNATSRELPSTNSLCSTEPSVELSRLGGGADPLVGLERVSISPIHVSSAVSKS